MSNNKKPVHFLLLKIMGVVGLIVAIIGFILLITGFGNFESGSFMIGSFIFVIGMFACICGFVYGFRPEIAKLQAKSVKYIQEQNKDDLQDIVSTGADISSEGIAKTVKAIKKGLKDSKFCTECGKEIDKDSKFCNYCGKEQN